MIARMIVVYSLCAVAVAAMLALAFRRDRCERSTPSTLDAQSAAMWAELDRPATGACPQCRRPVTGFAIWCDRVCTAAWLEGAS